MPARTTSRQHTSSAAGQKNKQTQSHTKRKLTGEKKKEKSEDKLFEKRAREGKRRADRHGVLPAVA
jgi:hypothetical protein